MAGHILDLCGCTPEPLGNYLKALGVFRLVGEQADPQARAWWKNGTLRLATRWDKKQLIEFFRTGIGEERQPVYSPTPIFAPWGGRPGFYKDGNAKAKARLVALRDARDESGRFEAARQTLSAVETLLDERGWRALSKKQREKVKQEIVSECRCRWRGNALDWFDACLAIEEDTRFGFLYGTGGNEGSADITNNFWELIEEVVGLPVPQPHSEQTLRAALFGEFRFKGTSVTAGQHFPWATGKIPNYGQGFRGSGATNPWDVVLMMEGCVLFAGAATKRLSQLGRGKAAFPFMLDHLAITGSSSSQKDEAKQDASIVRCRAEFWMPIWEQPLNLGELRSLLAEGRLQRPSGEAAQHTLHAMESVACLSVSRGITAFERFGLFERRGKGYYVASTLGREAVPRCASSVPQQLLDLDEFRTEVYRNLREGPAMPSRVLHARSRFHDRLAAILDTRNKQGAVLEQGLLLDVLASVVAIEQEVAFLNHRSRLLQPCRAMPLAWSHIHEDVLEENLARAIASLTAWGDEGGPPNVEAIRANLLPLARKGNAWKWEDTSRSAVWSRGASLEDNLARILRRRLTDTEHGSGKGLPLWSPYGASFESLLAFWERSVDESRLAELIHGLALVDYGFWNPTKIDQMQMKRDPTPSLHESGVWFTPDDEPRIRLKPPRWNGRLLVDERDLDAAFALPRAYCLLKLCFLGGRLPARPTENRTQPAKRSGTESYPPRSLDILNRLLAGRLPEAVKIAMQRLRAKGLPPILDDDFDMLHEIDLRLNDCRRLAGMLLIPVRHPGVLAGLVIKPHARNN